MWYHPVGIVRQLGFQTSGYLCLFLAMLAMLAVAASGSQIKVFLLTERWEKIIFLQGVQSISDVLLFIDNICSPDIFEDVPSFPLCVLHELSSESRDYNPPKKGSDLLGQFHSRT